MSQTSPPRLLKKHWLTILVLVGVLWSLDRCGPAVYRQQTFDRAAWLTQPVGEQRHDCYRGGMADDIVDRIIPKGTLRSEVEAALGPPDRRMDDGSLRYYLGYCSGFRMDIDALVVLFDSDGRVRGASTVQL